MSDSKNAFVMDCSMTMSLLFFDENNRKIEKVESLLVENKAYVPNIWPYEVANVLCMAERSKRINVSNIEEFKSILDALPIIIDDASSTKTFGNTLNLARECNLTVYDAAYLELAMREGIALSTLDKALIKSAKHVGTEVI